MQEIPKRLSKLLETPSAFFTAEELAAMGSGPRGALVRWNVLALARTATHVACDHCYEGHVEEVMLVPAKGRAPEFYLRCPEAGWVPVAPDRLRQWRLNGDGLAAILARALDHNRAVEPIVHQALWRLGDLAIAGEMFPVVLIAVEEEKLPELVAALSRSCPLAQTVAVAAQSLISKLSGFAAVLPVDAAFRMNGEALQCDVARIQATLRAGVALPLNVFQLQGQFWNIAYEGHSIHLKDSVGLAYLARILREPDRDIPAVALLAARAGIDPLAASGSSGAVLDEEAKLCYQKRYLELEEDLLQSRENNDLARIERLEGEMDLLVTELARATGLGGRDREKSDVEKVRKSVSMAVSREIKKIEAQHPTFGRHLLASVSSGRVFRYAPATPHDWLV